MHFLYADLRVGCGASVELGHSPQVGSGHMKETDIGVSRLWDHVGGFSAFLLCLSLCFCTFVDFSIYVCVCLYMFVYVWCTHAVCHRRVPACERYTSTNDLATIVATSDVAPCDCFRRHEN